MWVTASGCWTPSEVSRPDYLVQNGRDPPFEDCDGSLGRRPAVVHEPRMVETAAKAPSVVDAVPDSFRCGATTP